MTARAGGPGQRGSSGAGRPVVLALRALGLGDALTGVAALRGLRRALPAGLLVLAGPAGPGELLRRRGVVDRVLPLDAVAAVDDDAVARALAASPEVLQDDGTGLAVDLAVNLHGRGPQSTRALSGLLAERGASSAEVVAFACAAAGHTDGPAWDAAEHEVLRWCRLVRTAGGGCGPEDLLLDGAAVPAGVRTGAAAAVPAGAVVLHPGAASGSRRWPVRRWAEVAAVLDARGQDVVLTGGPAETGLTRRVADLAEQAGASRPTDLAGRYDLEGLADLITRARLLVCGDTGVAHLATAVRTPSVLLMGPSAPASWGPVVDVARHAVLWPAPDAGYRGDARGDDVDPVLARTTVVDVVTAAGRMLTAT